VICYRDRTWCASPGCVGACGRQWSAAEQAKAEAWWGGKGAPVAFANFCDERGRVLDRKLVNKEQTK